MKIAGKMDTLYADVTYYVSGTGSDTTGDGSSGAPWATLQKAFDYVATLRLQYPADVTITIADGHYSWTGPLICVSPWGSRISVQGTNIHEKTMSSVQSGAGDQITVNLNNVTNIEAGDLAIFHTCAGGTTPYHMAGCHIVESVDAVNSRITVTTENLVGLPSGNVTATVEIIKTVITFASTNGIYALPALKLDKIGIVGPGSTYTGLYLSSASRLTLSETSYVGITGFATGISCGGLGVTVVGGGAGRLSVSGCTIGVQSLHNSSCQLGSNGAQVTGCTTGVYAAMRGSIDAAAIKLHGNTTAALASQGGYINCTGADTTGNGTALSPTANTEGNDHAYIET